MNDEQQKKNGAIQGDIRQARQTRAPEGIAANIPGVTETVNAQGNRSFTGRGGVAPGQPKPAAPAAPIRTGVMIPEVGKAASGGSGGGGTPGGGGIMAGVDKVGRWPKPDDVSLAMSVQPQKYPGTRVTETVNAQGNRSFSGNTARPQQNQIDGGLAMAGVGYNKPASERIADGFNQFIGTPVKDALTYRPGMAPYGSSQTPVSKPNPFAGKNAPSGDRLDALNTQLDGINAQAPVASPRSSTNAQAVQPKASGAPATTVATGAGTAQGNAGQPVADQYGITRDLTADGRRSFSGTGVGAPGQVNTIDMGITDAQRTGRSGVANPAFEKALAAGDYETAMKMVNRGDTSQMTRLGQLQGQLRQQRDLAAAEAADRNYNGESAATRSAREAASRAMIENAKRLSDKGFSKGALRNIQAANGAETGGRSKAGTGIATGINPSETQTADEFAQQQAATDVAQAQATQAQTTQRQQGILQGLLDQINSEDATPEQRQSLIQRYQALANDGNAYEGRVVDSYDAMGNKTGQTLYTINQRTGQAQAVQPQQQQSQLQVGAVYASADGTQAKLAGYDESGNPIWEAVK